MLRPLTVILLIATVAGAGVYAGSAQPGATGAGPVPGDDFFAYANGEWLAGARIPPGKGRWGARDEIAATTALQVARVIREARSTPSGAKVADFLSAYLDEAGIERNSPAALKASLAEIDRIGNAADLSRYLGAHLRADVDPLGTGVYDSANPIGFTASHRLYGTTTYAAYLTQGGLGLRDREAYLDSSNEKDIARTAYRQYVALMLAAAGFDGAMQRAQACWPSRRRSPAAMPPRRIRRRTATPRTTGRVATSIRKRPGSTGVPSSPRRASRGSRTSWCGSPRRSRAAAALVARNRLPVWKDYLRFQLLDREADVLPQRFAAYARTSMPPTERRRERAIEATSRMLPEEVGRLYVARHFPPERKARVQAILDQVVVATRRRVANAGWMSPQARDVALAKLDTVYFGVGYPDKWPDASGLVIDAHDAIGNVRRIERWRYERAVAKLGREVDRREWAITAQTPGAVLIFELNAYNFAAALLQAPKFDADESDAANYGAIGAIFAHELTHFVDTLGSGYDVRGAPRNWWTAEDRARYETLSRPLVAQFAAYRPLPMPASTAARPLVENFS
jgi:predicted metalloendopeptidase